MTETPTARRRRHSSTSSQSIRRRFRLLCSRLVRLLVPTTLLLSTTLPAQAAARAFPGAEGFGAMVSGGRGGAVVHVTNLKDSGAGSLRDAVSAGNRIVVFDVGGVITISSPLVISGNNITVAGQTAPGHGITVYGDGTSVSTRDNVILRYIRFRQGIDSSSGTKALNGTDATNMIWDHISVQWGRWDTIGLTGNTKTVTVQYSLLGESIDPQRFGGLVDGANDVSLSHNLWIDSQSRSPKFKANGQYINNVIYNWGANGLGGGHSGADWYEDIINNFMIKGPSSTGGLATLYASTDHVFNSGNLADLDLDGKLSGRPVVAGDFTGDTPPTFETAAHNVPSVPVTVETATAAYASVVAGAGASLCRDAVDLRLIGHVMSLGTKGAIIVDESLVGGQPSMPMETRPAGFDTDADGMPDAWETAHGLNPNSSADGSTDPDGDGYTNVEAYLNALVSVPPDLCGATPPNSGTGETGGFGGANAGGSAPSDSGAGSGGTLASSSGGTPPDGTPVAGSSNSGGASTSGGASASGGIGAGGNGVVGGSLAAAGAPSAGDSSASTSNKGAGCGCVVGRRPVSSLALTGLAGLALILAGERRRKRSRRRAGRWPARE